MAATSVFVALARRSVPRALSQVSSVSAWRHGACLRRRFSASAPASERQCAVVLSGCGVYDGTEVHEASAVLVNLSRLGVETTMFAPDMPQAEVINHTNGESEGSRNVLEESARIARGHVSPLEDLDCTKFDAIIFPGGFGAAKNLSDFAFQGTDMVVNEQVERVIKDFHEAGKPIGMCCIAPVLAAKCLPGCSVTMGSDQESARWPHAAVAGAVQELKSEFVTTEVDEVHVDEAHNLVTTAAYMCEAKVHEVFDGVKLMVETVHSRM
eukprot:m.31354 g.31354  ORF g.31354 m.31354 type:complete len:268 (-) comp9724_c0_seq2:137-940(-)